MKSILLAFILCICIGKGYGQRSSNLNHIIVEITKIKSKVLAKVKTTSDVPFTDIAWIQALEQNITQSIQLNKRPLTGNYLVSVRFIIDKEGNISDILCDKDPGYGMCKEVVQAIIKIRSGERRPIEVKPLRT
jgi:hypothetical protein